MKAQARSHSGTRHLFAIGVAIFAMLMMGLFQPAGAQVDPASCGHYDTQEGAQEDLEAHPEFAVSLDPDGNGIACEGVFGPGDPEIDPFPCRTFKSQEQAQYFLDTYGEQWSMLDPDGNGIACEEEFGTDPPVVVLCNEAFGTLVEVSQVALDQHSIDFPYHRATQAEIAAGECAVTSPVRPTATPVTPAPTPVTPSDDGKPATGMVTNLPLTGTGTSEAQGPHAPLVAVPMALILAILWRQLRNRQSLG